jgi:hypothetical protein
MTPEEKAMTEKALQSTDSGDKPKIPLREDTFKLVGGENKPKAETEKKPTVEELAAADGAETKQTAEAVDPIQDISHQALTKVIDEKLTSLKKVDFLNISINKTGAMVGLGIVLILIWLLPAINFGIEKGSGGRYSLANLRSDVLFGLYPPATPAPVVEAMVKLRIKTNIDSLKQVNAIELKLREAGYPWIETIYDEGVANSGILIATRDENEDLGSKLEEILAGEYTISSESATLTEDSDFAAAILVGNEPTPTATDSGQ